MANKINIPAFGECFADARRRAGYQGQEDVAKAAGMFQTNVSRLELGKWKNPGWSVLYRLVVGLRLPLDSFFPPDLILDAADRIKKSNRKKANKQERGPDPS